MNKTEHRAGFVALVGRTNAGKSTLLNQILGRKLAIVTPKPQTTRHRILGILHRPEAQLLFVDTPGWHQPRNLLGEHMLAAARQSLGDTDIALWVVDVSRALDKETARIGAELLAAGRPTVIVANKIDLVGRAGLLAAVDGLSRLAPGAHVVPVSARTADNLPELLTTCVGQLPESPPLYPADAETDLPERFFAAELVREQVMLATHQELPYQAAVTVDEFREEPERNLLVLSCRIVVARTSQRPIVLGEKGSRIREIGTRARAELESFFGSRVYLDLVVRVDPGWFRRAGRLRELGI